MEMQPGAIVVSAAGEWHERRRDGTRAAPVWVSRGARLTCRLIPADSYVQTQVPTRGTQIEIRPMGRAKSVCAYQETRLFMCERLGKELRVLHMA